MVRWRIADGDYRKHIKCFVTVVGSFQLKMLSVRQGTQHFTDENKVSRKWSDSVHLITSLIRTTPLLIEFCVSKFKTKVNQVKLTPFITRHIHKLTWDQQSTLVPNLFNVYQLFATTGVTIIVALFFSLFNVHVSSLLHYRTSQNTFQVSQPTFQILQSKMNTSFNK